MKSITKNWEDYFQDEYSLSTFIALKHAEPEEEIHKLWARLDRMVLAPDKIKKIRRMQNKGLNGTEIAELLGCTTQYIYKVWKTL